MNFKRVALDPIVLQQPVFPHMEDRGSRHADWRTAGRKSHKAIVAAGHQPAGHDSVAARILEAFDDGELKIIDAGEEGPDPCLEGFARADFDAAGCDRKILSHQPVGSSGVLLLPHLAKEGFDDFY